MRMVFLALVAAYTAVLVWAAATLPARVPLHFGATGQADQWGSKATALLTFALVGAFTAVLLGGLAHYADRLPLRSSWVNLPHKQWWIETPEREHQARKMLATDLHVLAALIMAVLLTVLVFTVRAGQQQAPALEPAALVIAGALLLIVLGWAVWLATGRFRPPKP